MGQAVALDGNTAIVGADAAAYVFVGSGASFTLQQQLLPPDGAGNNYFGMSVAVSGDWVAVGSYLDATNDLGHPGSAYLFERHGTTWDFAQKLQAPDGSGDWFGFSVALSHDRVLVGADYEDRSGAAYVFFRGDREWTLEQRLAGIDDGGDDKFGAAVALDERTAIVGAWSTRVDDFGQAGLAYAYEVPDSAGAGGASGDETGAGGAAGAAGAADTPPEPAVDAGVRPPPIDASSDGASPAEGHDEPATTSSVPDGGPDASEPDGENVPATSATMTEPTETVTEGDWGPGCSVGTVRSPRRPGGAAFCLVLFVAFTRRRASRVALRTENFTPSRARR
jgi:hypothetical protein